jgi:hypothetical protein
MLFTIGVTVMVSFPSAVPDLGTPRVISVPEIEMEEGVDEDRVIVPPDILKEKSLASRAEPLDAALTTASLMVTVRVLLSDEMAADSMIGEDSFLKLRSLSTE